MGALLAAAALVLTGCSSATADIAAASEADAITIEDAWVKAAETGDMTSAFAILENTSNEEVTVIAVESTASPVMELHETVVDDSGQMIMREVEGGFTIAANDHLHLEPGGDHIMLLELPEPVIAGDDVTFTFEFADGSTLEFDALVKDFAGAQEDYGDFEHDHGEHDHGEHDDHDDH